MFWCLFFLWLQQNQKLKRILVEKCRGFDRLLFDQKAEQHKTEYNRGHEKMEAYGTLFRGQQLVKGGSLHGLVFRNFNS